MIGYARAEGLKRIEGQVLRDNVAMLKMCRELGFSVQPMADQNEVHAVSLTLS
jgi:acetyltransferase